MFKKIHAGLRKKKSKAGYSFQGSILNFSKEIIIFTQTYSVWRLLAWIYSLSDKIILLLIKLKYS